MWKTRFLLFRSFLNSVKFQVALKSILNANQKVTHTFCAIHKHFSILKIASFIPWDSWVVVLGRFCLFICLFILLVRKPFFSKCYFSYNYERILLILHMNHLKDVPHSACSLRGDVAIFGALATDSIFKKKMVFYIVTQVIDCNVTIVAQRKRQDMRVPHARAHLETQWCVKVRVHRYLWIIVLYWKQFATQRQLK